MTRRQGDPDCDPSYQVEELGVGTRGREPARGHAYLVRWFGMMAPAIGLSLPAAFAARLLRPGEEGRALVPEPPT